MAGYHKHLLEQLAENLGCAYLSDLRNGRYGEAVYSQLSQIREEEYSLQEWNDAIQYFGKNQGLFYSSGVARDFLLQEMKKAYGC